MYFSKTTVFNMIKKIFPLSLVANTVDLKICLVRGQEDHLCFGQLECKMIPTLKDNLHGSKCFVERNGGINHDIKT